MIAIKKSLPYPDEDIPTQLKNALSEAWLKKIGFDTDFPSPPVEVVDFLKNEIAGLCNLREYEPSDRSIKLSHSFITSSSARQIQSVFLHEVAHRLTGEGHTIAFASVNLALQVKDGGLLWKDTGMYEIQEELENVWQAPEVWGEVCKIAKHLLQNEKLQEWGKVAREMAKYKGEIDARLYVSRLAEMRGWSVVARALEIESQRENAFNFQLLQSDWRFWLEKRGWAAFGKASAIILVSSIISLKLFN
jgi:hypothetical protein